MDKLYDGNPFASASQALGLRIDLAATRAEPRFSLVMVHDDHGPRLQIRTRNDQSIAVAVIDLDPDPPGLLIEVREETVQREPVLDLWLPHSTRHLHLLHRRHDGWVVDQLPAASAAATVAEARRQLERPSA